MSVQTAPPPSTGQPLGANRTSRVYFDEEGRRRTAHIMVPVNQNGQLAARGWRCRRCTEPFWGPLGGKGVPVCPVHERQMVELVLRRPPLLPWRDLWDAAEKPVRPVFALPVMAGLGAGVDVGGLPMLAAVAVVPVVFDAARRAAGWWKTKEQVDLGNLDPDDPEHGKRVRKAIDKASRLAGYSAAAAGSWLTAAAGLGLDPHTWAGRVAWSLLPVAWLPVAATWWRTLRLERDRPAPVVEVSDEQGPREDPEHRRVRMIWTVVLAAKVGDRIGVAKDGTPILATEKGKLPGTRLEDWRPIVGGWTAVIVGSIGKYESDDFVKAVGKIAAAFEVKKSMVTVMPDPDDENRATLMVQKSSPIKDTVRWAGPDSIDPVTGQAPFATYADGDDAMYELYRPGWGCPHDFLCGTTGAGKSEALSTLLLIDRWAHHVDEEGQTHGMVADLLIDPQQGQSYGPFLDDLAAPVATTIEEAMLVVEAFRREMLRRNKHLANVLWEDEKGRTRKGRKWWNPLVDGPILTLNIDEAHEFLSFKAFSALVTKGARMYRKCGMRVRIATHTPLLTDLGGSMALRDMLTGGNVWMGRTANSLSGPTAFNGRLPVDPRSIPANPGSCFLLSATTSKPMLARTMWEPDYYDWVRDGDDQPIGFPAVLPQETWDAFGPDFAKWSASVKAGDDVPWTPSVDEPAAGATGGETSLAETPQLATAVLVALNAVDPRSDDMNGVVNTLRLADVQVGTLQVRAALAELRRDGLVVSADGRHQLTEQGRELAFELVGQPA